MSKFSFPRSFSRFLVIVVSLLAFALVAACNAPQPPQPTAESTPAVPDGGQTPDGAQTPEDGQTPGTETGEPAGEQTGDPPTATPISLAAIEGITWRLLSLAGQDMSAYGITLTFASQQIGGSSGCNSYSADFALAGDVLTLGPIAGTMMACDQGMDAEATYLAALAGAERVVLGGEQLTLTTAAGDLQYGKVAPVANSSLTGAWQLEAFAAGNTTTSLLNGTAITANFSAGELSGTAGCNQYTGSYTLETDLISVGPLATTDMACEPAINEQEQRYLNALATAGQLSIDGDRLTIDHADGTLYFRGAAAEPEMLNLPSTRWTLTGATDAALVPPADAPIVLEFDADTLGGVAGCNNFGGGYVLEGSQLRVGELVQTLMACEETIMAREEAFLAALRQATAVRSEGDALIIVYPQGELRFDTAGDVVIDVPVATPEVPSDQPTPPAANPDETLVRMATWRIDVTYPPLQAFVVIGGSFNDSCTAFTRTEQSTNADGVIIYNIYAARPADAVCAQVITPFEESFDLDISGLGSGTHTIEVNGSRGTFQLRLSGG